MMTSCCTSLRRCVLVVFGIVLLAAPARPADEPAAVPADWLKPLTWRCVGPANMSGRIIAISVYEADPSTYWIGTASGGLLKTTNNGTSFEHQFDHEATVSIGDVCVAPSDKNIVYVGTGENNPRNSVSYGDGVYKSTDGGKTWKNVGLNKTFQIGRVVVHPKNPNIVYVGALGRLYGPSSDRGLYKTSDGGQTWERILFVDDKTGVIDISMNPADPETLLIATYERQRDGYDFNDPIKKWGPGAGLYKTTDGGKSFRRITQGLPTCNLGRMGLDHYRKQSNVVYLILESEKIGMGPPRPPAVFLGFFGIEAEDAGYRVARLTEGGPAEKAGLQENDVILSLDGKPITSNADVQEATRGRKVGENVKLKYRRGTEEKEVQLALAERPQQQGPGGGQRGPGGGQRGGAGQGGRQRTDAQRPYAAALGGQEENVHELQGADGNEYGGIYKSTDAGDTWTRINSVNPRPMYFSQIRCDPSNDRYLYVLGVSLYRSTDGGKNFRQARAGVHADQHALWIDPKDGRHMLVGCDGGFYVTYDRMTSWDHLNHVALGQFYHVALDTRPNYYVYGGLQDNGSWGGPSRTRGQTGPVNEDWINVGGGDGFVCAVDPHDPDLIYSESQNGNMRRRNLRTGEQGAIRPRPQDGQRFRFNWKTPFLLSHHNSKIYYCAGNYVFRSLDRGNDLRAISPELTRTDKGSATALAESAKNPNVLWAGTDDGALWVTQDGGSKWTNVTANVGLPAPFWVASIEASRFAEGRAYVAFDGHRSDDDNPHVYVTEDFGKTWKSLRANLPWGSTRVLREDLQNEKILYLGTEFGVWASFDRGYQWLKLNNNLPTVAVHEFAQHPTTGELVAATHGRSLWIVDVTPLRQLKPAEVAEKPALYKPTTAYRWVSQPAHGRTTRRFVGQNPPSGAQLYYTLPAKAEKVALKVLDIDGNTVAQLTGPTTPGLHRVSWDLSRGGNRQGGGRFGGGGGGRGAGGRGQAAARPAAATEPGTQPPANEETPAAAPAFAARPLVPPGAYRVVLTVDGKEFAQSLRVEADPDAPARIITEEDE